MTPQACDEEKLLGHLGVVLYEYLGEEYPDVLGSILGALKAIVNVIGMTVRAALCSHPHCRFRCLLASRCWTNQLACESWPYVQGTVAVLSVNWWAAFPLCHCS